MLPVQGRTGRGQRKPGGAGGGLQPHLHGLPACMLLSPYLYLPAYLCLPPYACNSHVTAYFITNNTFPCGTWVSIPVPAAFGMGVSCIYYAFYLPAPCCICSIVFPPTIYAATYLPGFALLPCQKLSFLLPILPPAFSPLPHIHASAMPDSLPPSYLLTTSTCLPSLPHPTYPSSPLLLLTCPSLPTMRHDKGLEFAWFLAGGSWFWLDSQVSLYYTTLLCFLHFNTCCHHLPAFPTTTCHPFPTEKQCHFLPAFANTALLLCASWTALPLAAAAAVVTAHFCCHCCLLPAAAWLGPPPHYHLHHYSLLSLYSMRPEGLGLDRDRMEGGRVCDRWPFYLPSW